jgi:hypothetical protein
MNVGVILVPLLVTVGPLVIAGSVSITPDVVGSAVAPGLVVVSSPAVPIGVPTIPVRIVGARLIPSMVSVLRVRVRVRVRVTVTPAALSTMMSPLDFPVTVVAYSVLTRGSVTLGTIGVVSHLSMVVAIPSTLTLNGILPTSVLCVIRSSVSLGRPLWCHVIQTLKDSLEETLVML